MTGSGRYARNLAVCRTAGWFSAEIRPAGNDFGLPILPKLPKITVFGGFQFSVDSGGTLSEGIRAEDFTPPERKN